MSDICRKCNTGISSTDSNASWDAITSEATCSSCQVNILTQALKKISLLGHNDDCMFCGFKDKVVMETLGGN